MSNADLPPDNLVSALIGLEAARDRARLPALLDRLIALLRAQEDEELLRAFSAWIEQVLEQRRLRGTASDPPPRLEEVCTMLEETVREWVAESREQGLEQGIAEGWRRGLAAERALLRRQAARKFDDTTASRLAELLADIDDPSAWRRSETG